MPEKEWEEGFRFLEENRSRLKPREIKDISRECNRGRCLDDPYYVCSWLIGYPDLYEPLHRPMVEFPAFVPGRDKLGMWPRGHLKTSVMSIGYSIWRILRNANIRILLTNAIDDNAEKIAWGIQYQFRLEGNIPVNPRMAECFPEFMITAKRATKGRFTCPARKENYKLQHTVESSGAGSELVSNHYDLAINDDLVSLKCLTSDSENQKIKEFAMSVEPLIDMNMDNPEETAILTIGTRWHQSDLYGDMMASDENGRKSRLKVRCMGLKQKEGPNKGKYIFPTWWNAKREADVKAKLMKQPGGEFIFYSQYYNEARNRTNQKFTRDMFIFKSREWLREILPFCRKYLIVDPSATKQYYSDPASFIDLRVTPHNKWIVAGIINKVMDPDELVQTLYRIAAREDGLHSDIFEIVFEKLGLQNIYDTAIKYYGKGDQETGRMPQTLPTIKPSRATTVTSKEERIDGLQPLFRDQGIWIMEGIPNAEVLIDQLLNHRNKPKHDDVMDCLASAIGVVVAPLVQGFREPDEPTIHDIQNISMDEVKKLTRMAIAKNLRPGSFHQPAGAPFEVAV